LPLSPFLSLQKYRSGSRRPPKHSDILDVTVLGDTKYHKEKLCYVETM